MAQTEYDREAQARRDAEAEVTRLRILLSGQAARLSVMSGVTKKQELQEQLTLQASTSLDGLEREMSKLKVERDMTLAEVEELSRSKRQVRFYNYQVDCLLIYNSSLPEAPTRSLSVRFDNLKTQYQGELVSLVQGKESLLRELAELKASRDTFLEETTALNARNEELAKLNAQYARRVQEASVFVPPPGPEIKTSMDKPRPPVHFASSSTTSLATADDSSSSSHTKTEAIPVAKPKVFKWPGSKAPKEASSTSLASQNTENGKGKALDHMFQQLNVLRFTRCDHCADKMWGSQYRCSGEL